MFKCLNCGFVFVRPNYKRREPLRRDTWSPIVSTFYVACCPKCGSDALRRIEAK